MRRILTLTAALTLALPASSHAVPRLDVATSSDLWATVNVCDHGVEHANAIGIRGSIPGLGHERASVLYMRFQVQFLAKSDGKWHNIAERADSGFVRVGTARSRVLEAGRTFTFLPPADGGAHTLRGAVTFAWKTRGGRVIEKLRRVTEGGHPDTADSAPKGFSAATCQIS